MSVTQKYPNKEFTIDYDLVLKNIEDLNEIAGEGQHFIKYTKDGAKLEVGPFIKHLKLILSKSYTLALNYINSLNFSIFKVQILMHFLGQRPSPINVFPKWDFHVWRSISFF